MPKSTFLSISNLLPRPRTASFTLHGGHISFKENSLNYLSKNIKFALKKFLARIPLFRFSLSLINCSSGFITAVNGELRYSKAFVFGRYSVFISGDLFINDKTHQSRPKIILYKFIYKQRDDILNHPFK